MWLSLGRFKRALAQVACVPLSIGDRTRLIITYVLSDVLYQCEFNPQPSGVPCHL